MEEDWESYLQLQVRYHLKHDSPSARIHHHPSMLLPLHSYSNYTYASPSRCRTSCSAISNHGQIWAKFQLLQVPQISRFPNPHLPPWPRIPASGPTAFIHSLPRGPERPGLPSLLFQPLIPPPIPFHLPSNQSLDLTSLKIKAIYLTQHFTSTPPIHTTTPTDLPLCHRPSELVKGRVASIPHVRSVSFINKNEGGEGQGEGRGGK